MRPNEIAYNARALPALTPRPTDDPRAVHRAARLVGQLRLDLVRIAFDAGCPPTAAHGLRIVRSPGSGGLRVRLGRLLLPAVQSGSGDLRCLAVYAKQELDGWFSYNQLVRLAAIARYFTVDEASGISATILARLAVSTLTAEQRARGLLCAQGGGSLDHVLASAAPAVNGKHVEQPFSLRPDPAVTTGLVLPACCEV